MKVSDIMHSLFGTHKEAVLPVFERLLPLFVKLLVRNDTFPPSDHTYFKISELLRHNLKLTVKSTTLTDCQ